MEGLLPPKKEYVIYAPLSVRQRDLYDEIVEGRIRRFLLAKGIEDPSAEKKDEVDVNAPRQLRGGKRRRYDLDGSDDEYFERMEKGEEGTRKKEDEVAELGRQYQLRESGTWSRNYAGRCSRWINSQGRQQHAPSKHGDATAQGMFASAVVPGSDGVVAGDNGGVGRCEWQDDVARTTAGRPVSHQAQGALVQPVYDHVGHYRGVCVPSQSLQYCSREDRHGRLNSNSGGFVVSMGRRARWSAVSR